MKKLLLSIALFTFASASYADVYKCWRYVDGKPTGGWIDVNANSESDAVTIALAEYTKMGNRVDSVSCEFKSR